MFSFYTQLRNGELLASVHPDTFASSPPPQRIMKVLLAERWIPHTNLNLSKNAEQNAHRPPSCASATGCSASSGVPAACFIAVLTISYTRKHVAFAGKLRAMAGPNPLYSPPMPSAARVCMRRFAHT